ncbi:MAG: hypothetical protein IMZ53_11385 [Thermoplasmata archaeon]|nr:hypothetical protein [Thermoplasmata archaeon]
MDRFGDIMTWATEDLNQRLIDVVNAKSSRIHPYYILVITKDGYLGQPAGNQGLPTKTMDLSTKKVVHNTIEILEQKPIVPMLGTSLFYVDNSKGFVKCIYVLPLDKPMIGDFEVGGESGLVHKSAQGMPIIYDN